jgi:hypothetical protein
MTEILCFACGKNPAQYCHFCLHAGRIKREKEFTRQVWEKAGGKCEMCGMDDKRCLTIHHLEGNGENKYNVGKAQLLCLNCHIGKIHKQIRND